MVKAKARIVVDTRPEIKEKLEVLKKISGKTIREIVEDWIEQANIEQNQKGN